MDHTAQPDRAPDRSSVLSAALALGAVVRLRKAHPCGSDTWTVVRLGADIGLRCSGCGRRVLLPRAELARRMRAVVAAPGASGTTPRGG